MPKRKQEHPSEHSAQPSSDHGGNAHGASDTERTEAENRQLLLSTVAEESPITVCIAGEDGLVEYINPRLLESLGLSLREAIGMQWWDCLSTLSELRGQISMMRRTVVEQHDTWRADTSHVDEEGNPIWRRNTVFPVLNAHGDISHIVFTGEDITAYMEAEQARQMAESQYAALVDHMTDGIAIIQDGNLRFVNPASFRILGYDSGELIDTPFVRYVVPESRDATMQRFRDRVSGKDVPGFYDLDLVRKDGTTLPVEVSASRLLYHGGYAVLALIRDISKRRQAEERLRQSQERYRALVQQSVMGIGVSRGNEVLFANPALLRIFGYATLEEFAAVPLLDHVAPPSREKIRALITKAERDQAEQYDFEYDILRADGTVRTLHAFSSYLHIEDGLYTQTVFEDVTERKRTEQQLRTSEAQLSNALRMAHAGHWEYDVASDTFTFNDNFYRIFRTTVEEVGGYTLSSREYARRFCHPDDMDMVQREVQAAIATDDPYYGRELEHRILFADGEVGFIVVRFFVVKDSEGRTVKTYGVNQDITERKLAGQRIRSALESTIQVVAETIETRDPYTAGHQKRVTKLAVAIAQHMQLPSEQIEGVRVAATLHDIGKVSTPSEILSKPGKLSETEFALIRQHPKVAHDILQGIAFPWPVAEIILQHHERLDGTGYPAGLSGGNIRLEARIIAVADTVEAMAEHRPYRPAPGIDAALAEIEQNRGTQYDPDVADACLALFREGSFTWDE